MSRRQSWKLDEGKASFPPGPYRSALPYLFGALLALSAGALAEDLALSSVPPYFVPSVEPNLIVSVEHSGTMHSGRLPWDLTTDEYFRKTPMATASEVNTLYYDPQITYLPAIKADGSLAPHGVFTAAQRSQFVSVLANEETGCTLDLSLHYEAVLIEEPQVCDEETRPIISWQSVYAHNTRNPDYIGTGGTNEWPAQCLYGTGVSCPAYYNVFKPGESCDLSDLDTADLARQAEEIDPAADPATDTALIALQAELDGWSNCFETSYVGSSSDIGEDQPGDLSAEALAQRKELLEEEGEDLSEAELAKRNFANWYVYHRTVGRNAKSALSRAMDGLGSNIRVTYQPDAESLDTNLAGFSGTGKSAFYDWLFALDPLLTADSWHVSATLNAGAFASNESAYRTDLDAELDAVTNPSLSCRNNLHLLLTASPWIERIQTGGSTDANCDSVVTRPAWLSNNDGTSTTLPDTDSTSYDARTPYGDGNTGMLADIAFYFWATDLIDLTDNVSPLISDTSGTDEENYWYPLNDPAEWQHLTTFTVGMDLRGSVTFDRDAFFVEGDYAAGSSIGTDGFPGTVNTIGQCSADWGSELNLDDIWHTGVNGRGGFINATNSTDLLTALTLVTDRVADAAGSSSTSSESLSTGVLFNGDMVYQSVMNPSNWSGDLQIIQISYGLGESPCPQKEIGELCQDVADGDDPWRSAAEELAGQNWNSGRKILTRGETAEFAFSEDNWDSFSTDQQAALMHDADGTDADKVLMAKARINYLRGERTYEASRTDAGNPYTFRDRTTLIGDIIGSSPPVVVGSPYRYYQDNGYSVAVAEGSLSFRDTHADRTEVVYVGANDGMLHAFQASGDNAGQELFAYVPKMIYDSFLRTDEDGSVVHQWLVDFTMTGYGSVPAHRNFVDGPIAEGDAYFGSAWHSVLAVSAGLGAQGVFALDVTNPDTVIEQSVTLNSTTGHGALSLWELTDADDPDIGYVIGRPSIVQIPDGVSGTQWVVVFGNGYNSTQDDGHRASLCDADPVGDLCGEAVLFVMDIIDASEVGRYETGVGQADDPLADDPLTLGRANALAQPTVVDYDGDQIADAAYAGDLFGNLWRFDLTDTASTPSLLFTALEVSTDNEQPITTPPAVLRHPLGIGVLVIFGTGKLLEGSDVDDSQVQTIYGIWDDRVWNVTDEVYTSYCSNDRPDPLLRSDLLQQHLVVSDYSAGTVSNARVVSNNSIDWGINTENQSCNGHWGWYLDLVPTIVDGTSVTQILDSSSKERIIGAPAIDLNRLTFATVTPSTDRCEAGGFGWVNMIDGRDGSRLDTPTFDLDLNSGTSDLIDAPDATEPVPASSMQLKTAGGDARGIYTSPASLALEAGKELKGITTGQGSPTADETFNKWRVWRQIK